MFSGVDLTLASRLATNAEANVKSQTLLESNIYRWSFDSNIRKGIRCNGRRMLESNRRQEPLATLALLS
jgi:hypothetical protein